MNNQKKRIRQLRMIYEGIMDDNPEDYVDRGFILSFNQAASI